MPELGDDTLLDFDEDDEWDIAPEKTSIELPLEFHSKTIEFTVSGVPVSGSQLKFNTKTGHAYRPDEHRQRVFEIYEFACNEVPEDRRPFFRKGIPIAMGVAFYFPYRTQDYRTGKNASVLKGNAPIYVIGKKDLDNMLKPLKDAMKGVIYNDDKQIVRYLDVVKLYSESPRTVIRVQEVN